LDLQLHEWLTAYAKPYLTVATKSDKLSQNELRKNMGRTREILSATAGGGDVVAYSAVTGHGRERLWRAIEEALIVSHSPS
jgi:GTP-binding protein